MEEEEDSSRDLGVPVEEKKAPHPLAIMDKEAKSPFAGDTWKKVRWSRCLGNSGTPASYTSYVASPFLNGAISFGRNVARQSGSWLSVLCLRFPSSTVALTDRCKGSPRHYDDDLSVEVTSTTLVFARSAYETLLVFSYGGDLPNMWLTSNSPDCRFTPTTRTRTA